MIGLLDVDLLDKKSNFPNLALMKISGFWRNQDEETKLISTMDEAFDCDRLFVSKVFTESQEPNWLTLIDKPIQRGGTGYQLFDAPPLAYEVEHSCPDYDLYKTFADNGGYGTKKPPVALKASIGFTTRGCFRHCPFCVNRNKSRVERWSPLKEFYNPKLPYIFMLDDNILGYPRWNEVFDELEATGKRISYRQGMDIRLMTKEKAQALQRIPYWKDIIFSFDNISDKKYIEGGAKIYREFCDKETQCYLIVGFYNKELNELKDIVERIKFCKRYNLYPYLVRHKDCNNDKYFNIFLELGRFYNQRSFSRNGDIITYIQRYGSKAAKRILETDTDVRKLLEETINPR